MRVGIVGAGAIGGWIGVRLARSGHDVSVLARGATLSALREKPWRLDIGGKILEADVRASDDARQLGEQDVVIIAVKGFALREVAPNIMPMIGAHTLVIPAMNGVPWWFLLAGGGELPPTHLHSVDPDGAIARSIPLACVIGCVVYASAFVQAPGLVTHKGGNKLILGEPNGERSDRLQSICEQFRLAGFDIVASDRVQRDIWYKLWGNMTMNPLSAITGATCDRLLDDPLVKGLVLRVMAEAAEVGNHIGCPIEERGEDRINVTRQLGAFKTSMLQDAEAGRPLELEQIIGAPRQIAQLVQVPTPNMDALLGLARLFAQTHGLYSG